MKIGIVAPANTANPQMVAPMTAYAALAYPEVDLVFHPQCWESDGHFAGPDAHSTQRMINAMRHAAHACRQMHASGGA